MNAPTPLARLVEEKLRQAEHINPRGRGLRTLHDWTRNRREAKVSWQGIAQDIAVLTGERVTDETVRSWFPDLSPPKTAPAGPNPTAGDGGTAPTVPPDHTGPSQPGD